jgi:hypothetical protein
METKAEWPNEARALTPEEVERVFPQHHMTVEEFTQLLLKVRNGANMRAMAAAHRAVANNDPYDDDLADARAVWHTAEAALGLLVPHYWPKKETKADLRALLKRMS